MCLVLVVFLFWFPLTSTDMGCSPTKTPMSLRVPSKGTITMILRRSDRTWALVIRMRGHKEFLCEVSQFVAVFHGLIWSRGIGLGNLVVANPCFFFAQRKSIRLLLQRKGCHGGVQHARLSE